MADRSVRKDRVQYNADVPHWFTYALHRWSKRRCRRWGHQITTCPTVCDHCGEIFD